MANKKKDTGREIFDKFLFQNERLLADLEGKWTSYAWLKDYLKSKVPVDHPNRQAIFNAIDYTGEYPRRFRRSGTGRSLQKVGSRFYKTIDGVQHFMVLPVDHSTAERRAAFPSAVIKFFKKTGTKCALSGKTIDGLPEIDHRIPIARMLVEEPIHNDATPQEILQRYMGVCPDANKKKREICARCTRSGKRGGATYFEIPFWTEGTQNFDPKIGCRGCFWAFPEEVISKLSSRLGLGAL